MTTTVLAAPRAAVLAPLRDWLRTTSTGSAASVYAGGLPKNATFPSVVITKVGLSPDNGVTERTLLQFDCRDEIGSAAAAEELAALVKADLLGVIPGTQLGSSTVRLLGASIEGEVALPEPDGVPRYAVTAQVTTKVVA